LDALGANNSLDVYFEWGTTDSYGQTTSSETLSSLDTFSHSISGLTNEQEYHFRAVATNGVDYWYGEDGSFVADVTPVSVDTEAVSSVTFTTVTLNGTLNGMGYESSLEVFFEVGKTIAYNMKTESQTMAAAGSFSKVVDSLEDNTTYHIRAVATNGTTTWVGEDVEFTTDQRFYIEITTDPTQIYGAYLEFPLYVDLADLASEDHVLHRNAANNLYSDSNPNDFSSGTLSNTTEISTGLSLIDQENIIQTDSDSNRDTDGVQLNGELLSMNGESTLDVYFEWGVPTSGEISYTNQTTTETKNSTGEFNSTLAIGSGGFLDYRAVATDGTLTWVGSNVRVYPYIEDEIALAGGLISEGSKRTILYERDIDTEEFELVTGTITSGSKRTVYYSNDTDTDEIYIAGGEITGGSKI
jgi:hypothetical protein